MAESMIRVENLDGFFDALVQLSFQSKGPRE